MLLSSNILFLMALLHILSPNSNSCVLRTRTSHCTSLGVGGMLMLSLALLLGTFLALEISPLTVTPTILYSHSTRLGFMCRFRARYMVYKAEIMYLLR